MCKVNKNFKMKLTMLLVIFVLISGASISFAKSEKEVKKLTLVNVVETWANESEITWERHAMVKETDDYQLYEVAINEKNVKLYKFEKNLDTYYLTAEKREEYLVKEYKLPVKRKSEGSSSYVADAFKDIFEIVVKDSPSTYYGLKYTGHGSWDGYLFANNIDAVDSQEVLKHFTKALGRKVDFFDMSTNCNQATAGMLNAFYPYFDYILASELPVGGYSMDEQNRKKFADVFDFIQYPIIFSENTNLDTNLKKLAELSRKQWLYSKDNMIQKKYKQSLSIFKMSEYEAVIKEYAKIRAQKQIQNSNQLYKYSNTKQMKTLYDKLVIYRATNEDFFKWNIESRPFVIYQLENIARFEVEEETLKRQEAERRAKEQAEIKAKEEAERRAKEQANSSKSYWTEENYSLESMHDYNNNIYTVDLVEKKDAENIAVFFSKIATEENVDYIYVLDKNKKMVEKITGNHENKWVIIRGNIAYVCLVSNKENVDYGFKIEKIAYH